MPPSLAVAPITFAHRGARLEEAENTIPAFRRALEQGAEGLETDAWLSADGEVVLTHDPARRHRLRRIRVGSTDASELAALGIPRLVDLYDECGTDFELSVDVRERGSARPLMEIAARAGVAERLWLCSGSVGLLRELRQEGARCRLVHSARKQRITVTLERHASDLAAAGIDTLNMHHTDWTKGLVSLFHRFGIRAFAWDVQEVRYLRAVLGMRVDGLYCDRVDRMVATVAEWDG